MSASNDHYYAVREPNEDRRILKLSYTPKRLKLGDAGKLEVVPKLQARRDHRRANAKIRVPDVPMEAIVVTIHPCYRGPKLDGSYYKWLNESVYHNDMPDIIRRVNKFRGFPQQDDPRWNHVDADKWHDYYISDEGRAEMEPYLPYLQKYWQTNGDVYEDHTRLLDGFFENTDKDYGCVEVIQGRQDSRIMSDRAEAVTRLSTPPTEDPHRWEKEREAFQRDLKVRTSADQRFMTVVPDAVRDSSDQHGFRAWARANGLLVQSPEPQSPRYSPSTLSPASSGHYESIQQDRSSAAGPGLIWYNESQVGRNNERYSLTSPDGIPLPLTQNSPRAFQALVEQERSTPVRKNSPTESEQYWNPHSPAWSPSEMVEDDMNEKLPEIVSPGFSKLTDDEWEGAMREAPMPGMYQPPSAGSYHSPAGDIITLRPSAFPRGRDWDMYREHSYVQTLANSNLFQATPWMAGHSPVYELEQNDVDPDADDFGALDFPMGIRRWHHYQSPESHGLRSVRDRTPTPYPEVVLRAVVDLTTKREREDDADDEASLDTTTIVVRQPAPKRRRTATRKSGKSKKGRKSRKDGSEDEYEFTGLDHDEEDEKYEKPSRASGRPKSRSA
ncbi:hypothetical protein BJ166DRAFT_597672 [Pestalotiopsis sp. NC0098]|nr:hypothetical protein BJ166DRAFT_597672 [Pestalotiopsis sp. NC0098]